MIEGVVGEFIVILAAGLIIQYVVNKYWRR